MNGMFRCRSLLVEEEKTNHQLLICIELLRSLRDDTEEISTVIALALPGSRPNG